MAARPPTRRRPNPKKRRVMPPPRNVSLEEVERNCKYQSSAYHRTIPSSSGRPVYISGKSKCPEDLQQNPRRVQRLLKEAISLGHFGYFTGGFPRRVWSRVGDTVFEAKQGTPGSGVYHGYPLRPDEPVEGLK